MDSFDINNLLYNPITHDDERDYYFFYDWWNAKITDFLLYTPHRYEQQGTLYSVRSSKYLHEAVNDTTTLFPVIIDFLLLLKAKDTWEVTYEPYKVVNSTTNYIPFRYDAAGSLCTMKLKMSKPLLDFYYQTHNIRLLNV